MTFNVEFSKPSDISTDINDLDYLIVKFLMPEQIIDSQNFKYLAQSKLTTQVAIVPQYSEAEREEREHDKDV